MKMTITTPTIMKVLVSSSDGVGGEGGVEVKPGVRLLGGVEVAEGAVIVVEITASPGREEGGDGGSPSTRVDDTIIVAVIYKTET